MNLKLLITTWCIIYIQIFASSNATAWQVTPCEYNIAPYMDNILPNWIDLNNRAN